MQLLQKKDMVRHVNELLLISKRTYASIADSVSPEDSLVISFTLRDMLKDIEKYLLSHQIRHE